MPLRGQRHLYRIDHAELLAPWSVLTTGATFPQKPALSNYIEPSARCGAPDARNGRAMADCPPIARGFKDELYYTRVERRRSSSGTKSAGYVRFPGGFRA